MDFFFSFYVYTKTLATVSKGVSGKHHTMFRAIVNAFADDGGTLKNDTRLPDTRLSSKSQDKRDQIVNDRCWNEESLSGERRQGTNCR